jgi:Transposase DDE domain group 1
MSKENGTEHPLGEEISPPARAKNGTFATETFGGKIHVEWDPTAAVTPIGQLPFFIQFLKVGGLFEPWVNSCPLRYQSNNAPEKVDVLGSFLLSILSGHNRYAHMASLMGDLVNTQMLGMSKVISDDSARRALKKMDEEEGIDWLQNHLQRSYEPLLTQPWILDSDVTVKPLYGHQEGAKIGYNPHKPGRPSHTYHTYMIANLRLVLEVEVKPGTDTAASHSAPGLWALLDRLPRSQWPQFIRGDSDWGTDDVMLEAEERHLKYLFKLRKSKYVKNLIYKHHSLDGWNYIIDGWEAKDDQLKLSTWKDNRRVVIIRRRLPKDVVLALEDKKEGQQKFGFLEDAEDINTFEYAVLVTSLDDEVVSIVRHYRDRADCENNFDEIKNHWGWGGFTTRDIKPCRLISRIIALIYNWWNIFARLANPDKHMEAITSRPLLLSSVGRLTETGRKKTMTITSTHAQADYIQDTFQRIQRFFDQLKTNAPQLTSAERWRRILSEAMKKYLGDSLLKPPDDFFLTT